MNKDFPRPKNFPYDEVIYTDNEIAMIYGTYKNAKHKSIGMRWMTGESKLGYPNAFGRGMWMVVPSKQAIYLLKGILESDKNNIKIPEYKFEKIISELKGKKNKYPNIDLTETIRLNISNNNGDQTIFFKDATRKIISKKEWLKIEGEYPEYFI